jgi:hypothetical protein
MNADPQACYEYHSPGARSVHSTLATHWISTVLKKAIPASVADPTAEEPKLNCLSEPKSRIAAPAPAPFNST